MKQLLTLNILFYRCAIKPFYKRTCLFQVICSQEALNEARQNGFRAGLNTLNRRMKCYRQGFLRGKNPATGNRRLVFLDGKQLKEKEFSFVILNLIQNP